MRARPHGGRSHSSDSGRRLAIAAITLVGSILAAGEARAQGSAPDPDQQVILITGSTSGLGREVATRLGAMGHHIIVHGRDRERGAEVVAAIESGPGSARFYPADLASFEEVRTFGASILRDYERLDVLINNAGIAFVRGGRTVTEDGSELVFQVNHLSHFLLTGLLLPLLEEGAPSRIVNVSSIAQTPIDFDDVMMENGYDGGRAYAQSKLAQVMFTIDLAERLEGTGVIVNALHPATLMDTPMVLEAGIQPRASVDEGADAVMQLVTAPDIGSGGYFNGLERGRANAQVYDAEARARLWRLSEELTGMSYGTRAP